MGEPKEMASGLRGVGALQPGLINQSEVQVIKVCNLDCQGAS